MVMRVLAVAFLASTIGLIGCSTFRENTAQYDAVDRDKCISFGTSPGTPAYTDCRLKLERERAREEASRPLPPPRMEKNCPTSASGLNCAGPVDR